MLATGLDFLVYVSLVELLGVWYVASAAISALCGAVVAFYLSRTWCFSAQDGHILTQGIRFIVVSGISLSLNTSGVYLFTDILGFHYFTSKVAVAIIVSFLFNFPLYRYYVFKVTPAQ